MIEDRLLIRSFNQGDPAALCRIYEKYRDGLLKVAVAVLNDRSGSEDVLHATASDAALIALYPSPWNLEGAFSFAAEYRIANAGPRQEDLVFGYVDAANHWRLALDAAAGRARVVRVREGEESVVAEHPLPESGGEWRHAEVELDDGSLAFSLDDDAVEFDVTDVDGVPATEFGFHVPAGGSA